MKIRILDSTLEDLDRGRKFYDRQGDVVVIWRVLDLRQAPARIRRALP
jgi:hypothetical protein